MAEVRAVELAAMLREVLVRTRTLGALCRRLATGGQPEAIRPPLLELAFAKDDMAREIDALVGAIERDRGAGSSRPGTAEPEPQAEGPLEGLRGEGLAAACSAERSLQSLLREAVALADGSPPWASAAAALAGQAADHRRRILSLYQRYS